MSETTRRNAAEAFATLGPNNPLIHLSQKDKELLCAYLMVYDTISRPSASQEMNMESEERAARTAWDAAGLADRLEADVFHGPLAEILQPLSCGFELLPELLRAFASRVGGGLDLTGKPGRKGEVLVNQMLVTASEFVRLRTGRPNDEHVAELFQGISQGSGSDFSGAAIHKKRKRLEREYPAAYQALVLRLKKTFGSELTN